MTASTTPSLSGVVLHAITAASALSRGSGGIVISRSGSRVSSDKRLQSGPAVLLGHLPGSDVGLEPFILVGSEVDNVVVSWAYRSVEAIAIGERSDGTLLTTANTTSSAVVGSTKFGSIIATAEVLTGLNGADIECRLRSNPGAAVGISRVEGSGRVTINHTQIGVKHQLISLSVIIVSKFPLVLGSVTVDSDLGLPALVQQRFVVVIVENALVGTVRPKTCVTRVLRLGATNGVSTIDGSSVSPRVTSSGSINVLNEDLIETSASIFRVGQQTFVSASRLGGSAEAKRVHELLTKSAISEHVAGIVVGGSSDGHSLTSDDDEVCKRDIAANRVVDLGKTRSLHTCGKASIVTIVEVHAAVGTVSIADAVVHEVMTRETDEAACHGSLTESLLVFVEGDDSRDDALILSDIEALSRGNSGSGARKDLGRISGLNLLNVGGGLSKCSRGRRRAVTEGTLALVGAG